jgi:hypothetical protein
MHHFESHCDEHIFRIGFSIRKRSFFERGSGIRGGRLFTHLDLGIFEFLKRNLGI